MFTSSKTFSKKAALSAIQGSILAYADEMTIKESCEPAGWKIHFIRSAEDSGVDVQCFIAEGPDDFHVFFRGTEGIDKKAPFWNIKAAVLDWWQNFKMSRVAWAPANDRLGQAHKGFVEEFDAVQGKLIDVLSRDIEAIEKPVTAAGHSKGAALATLLADYLDQQFHEVTSVYTFGSPRVFDREAANTYKNNLGAITYRFFKSNDIVPRTPLGFRFKHVGIPIYVRQYAGYIFEVNAWLATAARVVSYSPGDFGGDHDAHGYHTSIMKHRD